MSVEKESALLAQTSPRDGQPTKAAIAVVGAGYWGPNLIRNFATLPTCRLAKVCELNRERLVSIAEQYRVDTTSSLQDLLADPSLDAVAIATPAESHRQVAEACLRAGKHVYVEKPLAASSQDAESMVRTAEQMDRILMVGHLFLYDPAVAKLIDLVHDGAIGSVRYAHGIRTSMSGTARLDTNIVWDALIHDAYILPELFGRPPERVQAVGKGYLSPGLEDVAFVTFDFGGGAMANVYVSWYALEKARKMAVIGSKAILAYDDLGQSRLTLYDRRYEKGDEKDPRGRHRWRWRDEGGRPVDMENAEPLRTECGHFIDCVAQGKAPRTGGQAGLEAVRILEACQRSLEMDSAWVEVSGSG
ncbi:MAG: Gfo/Idh/MocA family oxidoreductase [Chloroflexi bacterium]|nr:Gfo/Idh/MocA family oxidoreductase [Chloroflexota bacterium]